MSELWLTIQLSTHLAIQLSNHSTAEFRWRAPKLLFKTAGEVAGIVKAGLVGDFADGSGVLF